MYPMTFMFFSPLSGEYRATFPHLLELRLDPSMPNPILESHELQSFCSLLMMPILALELKSSELTTLNPSMLHSLCKEASEPIRDFHVLRPSEVARCCPSAISENRELASCSTAMKLICWSTFIPRQIFVKDVFQ